MLNVSDLWPLTARELGALKPGGLYSFLERREHTLFSRAAGWLGQSEAILEYMAAQCKADKPRFLYRNLPATTPDMAPPERPPNSPIKLVYAGLLGPVQGILKIVEAIDFAKLGFSLDLYGDGTDSEALSRFVAVHPHRGVRLCGLVPAAQMSALLPGYDAGLASLNRTIYGALPSKLFAAVGAGIPLLFCGGGEGEKLVQQHNLGWTCPPGDTGALTQLLTQIKALPPADWAAKKTACRQAASGVFNREAQEEAFLKFMEGFF